MSDPVRGITCPDMRRVVRAAIAAGWTWDGFTGSTHARIRWTDGTPLSFGTTPSVASWKSLASDIRRVSGVEVWRKGNRKRSRKRIETSGFSMDAARAERDRREAERARLARIKAAADRAERDRARRLAAADRNRRDIEGLMRPGD